VVDLQSVRITDQFFRDGQAIAGFLSQARSRVRPREFIALGRFDDMSVSARARIGHRLGGFDRQHLLNAGYGC